MLPNWFMWMQVVVCWIAAVGLLWNKNWWFAWVWICYGLANIGFAMGTR